jgi:glycine/D-amino acid oxidase-like deaminating enzyme/nitrite reductase/ring-hydroxylating ferredoxin subunit
VNRSYWVESTPETVYPPLEPGLEVDVAMLGGGITGLTTALLLKEEGLSVAVVEMKRVARGVSGYTTAKLTSGHGPIYAELRSRYGADAARLYGESNEAALAWIAEAVDGRGIDCDFERTFNTVYSEDPSDVEELREEAEAARQAGLDASFTNELPLPFPIAGAVRLEGQAQFHPRKYLLALAAAVAGDGSHVFEETRAVDVREGEPCTVETLRGPLRAHHVVVATHLPFLDRGLFFVKAHPSLSYAVAAPVDAAAAPDGMHISISQPSRSIRTTPDGDGRLLIVGGEGHKPGAGDSRASYAALERTARERFGAEEVRHRWCTHDYSPVDGLPYIGTLRRSTDRIFVATAFAKWGLTKGTLAAMIIRDAIVGRRSPWADLYEANRLNVRRSAPTFVKENAAVGARFVGDRLSPGKAAAAELAPGQGAIVRDGRRKLAVHRDEAGELHVLSARCTHLGCLVRWNEAETTWDCPCHGSRFAADGTLVEGPAVEDLPREQL